MVSMKRLLSLLLIMLMIGTALPNTAFAVEVSTDVASIGNALKVTIKQDDNSVIESGEFKLFKDVTTVGELLEHLNKDPNAKWCVKDCYGTIKNNDDTLTYTEDKSEHCDRLWVCKDSIYTPTAYDVYNIILKEPISNEVTSEELDISQIMDKELFKWVDAIKSDDDIFNDNRKEITPLTTVKELKAYLVKAPEATWVVRNKDGDPKADEDLLQNKDILAVTGTAGTKEYVIILTYDHLIYSVQYNIDYDTTLVQSNSKKITEKTTVGKLKSNIILMDGGTMDVYRGESLLADEDPLIDGDKLKVEGEILDQYGLPAQKNEEYTIKVLKIPPVPELTVTVALGTSVGSTKASITESAAAKFIVNITDTTVSTPREGDRVPVSGAYLIDNYTSGDDVIKGVAIDRYMQVYSVDTNGKIVGFYQKQLQNEDIRPTPTADSIGINEGATHIATKNITLKLSATHVAQMMISEDSSFTGATWEEYATSKEFTLSDGDGTKTIYIKFKDEVGNETAVISDSIILDTQGPTGTRMSIDEGDYTNKRKIHLTIHAAEAEKMMISQSEIFEGLSWESYKETKELTLRDEEGTKTIYIQFKDRLGNETEAISDKILLDTKKPGEPTIKRNPDKDLYNDDYMITLISGEDFESGIERTVYKTVYGEVYSKWKTYEKPFTISQEGITKVFAKTIDKAGNESDTVDTSVSINKDLDTFLTIKTDPDTDYSSEDYTITLITEFKDTVQDSVYANVYYKIDNEDFKVYEKPFTIIKKGQTTIKAKITDDFGNVSDEVTKTIYIFSKSDEDNDGVPNEEDKYPLDPTNSGRDTDKDGKDDALDLDDDNDGIEDTKDPYPLDPTKPEKVDNIPPIIKLKGENIITIEQGNPYIEQGYIVTDNIDKDLTGNVEVTGLVNTDKVGTYILTYIVKDRSGNKAEITRTIKVIEKETSKDTTIKADDEEKIEDKKIEDAIDTAKEQNKKDITIKVEKEVTTTNDVKVSISKKEVEKAKKDEVDLIFETNNTAIKVPMKAIDTSLMGSNSRLELVCENVDTKDENNKEMVEAVKNANASMEIYENKVFDFKMKVIEEDKEGHTLKEEEIKNFASKEDITLRILIGKVNQNTALMAYYYNPATKEWEYVRGSYENGSIKILTNHLSIYSVMTLTPEEKREMLTKLINDKDITIKEVLNILEDEDMNFKEKEKYNAFKQIQKEETAKKIIDNRPSKGYENYDALEKEINSIIIEIYNSNNDSESSSSKNHSSSKNSSKESDQSIENITIIKGKENTKIKDGSSHLLEPKDKDMHIRGKIYEITLKENKEGLLKIKYDEDEVINEDHIAVYKYNEKIKEWKSLGGIVDKEKNEIAVTIKKAAKITIMEYNKKFTDLDGHWAKETIEILASRQMISGDEEGKFRPNMGITRAEFATLITKMLNLEIGTKETGFEDIKINDWYAPYIASARSAGIVSGVSDTKYEPNRIVTRQEMTAMVVRAYKNIEDVKVDIDTIKKFKDNNQIADWAKKDVYTAKHLKFVRGRSKEIFAPTSETLRGEAAILIYSLLKARGEI
ncbi:S-layer homology domain-containing protein [Crassaminicella profunda]|uniref:S-layer homology domain-containing protein n=1 Tax=Crassaminicella profunda TaxID=1286698 RepID=UPI001CA79AC5|nr:S-layer homology domain-containing protein [Crassaminicella profunda]QZY54098.1 S-layer homology domain-containing protein [Crassaminicella profunda]